MMIIPRTFFVMVYTTLLTLLLCLVVYGESGYSLDVPTSTDEKGFRRKRQEEFPIMLPFDFGSDGQYTVAFSTIQFAQLVSCICGENVILYCTVEVNRQDISQTIQSESGNQPPCTFYNTEVVFNQNGSYALRINCNYGQQKPPFDTSDDSSCQFLYDTDESCPLVNVNMYLGSASDWRLEMDQNGSNTTVRLCNKANNITDGGGIVTGHSTSSVIDHSTSSVIDYSTSSVAVRSSSTTVSPKDVTMTTVPHSTSQNTNYTQTMARANSQEEKSFLGIIIGVVVGAVVLIVIVVVIIIVWRRKKRLGSATAKEECHADRTSSWKSGHANASSSEHYTSVYPDLKQPQTTKARMNKSDGYTDVTPEGNMTNNYSTVNPDIETVVKNDPQYSVAGEVSSDPKYVYSRLHEKEKNSRNPYDILAPLEKEPPNLGPSNKIPKGRDDTRDVPKDSTATDDVSALYAIVVKGRKAKNHQNVLELERQDCQQD